MGPGREKVCKLGLNAENTIQITSLAFTLKRSHILDKLIWCALNNGYSSQYVKHR